MAWTTTRRALGASAAAGLFAGGKPFRAAVLGTGHAHAAGKINALRRAGGFELVGAVEPDPRRRPAGSDFSNLRWLREEDVLQDPSIRLVAVESTVGENLDYAERAIAAGKCVHLDKPPGADLKRLERILIESERRGLVVQMGYQWRYHPLLRAALEAARSGWLGRVYMVRATVNQALTPQQRAPLAEFRGGMMFEMGCHLIDRIVEVLGPPRSVSGFLRHDGPVADRLEDNTLAVMEFERGMAEVYVAAQQPNGNAYRTFEILGANGSFIVQPYSPYRARTDLREAAGPYPRGPHDVELPPEGSPPFTRDFEDLAAILRGERKPAYTVRHDLAVHQALLAACGYAT